MLLVSVLFVDPLPSFNWWAGSVGGEELKWRQLAHHQLMSQQGPHWASEASPTLGCSIEISRDIYIYVHVSVVCQINCVGGIT